MTRAGDETGPVLELAGVERRFGGRAVLRGLDLQLQRGEVFGFLGPNGAGKTTTIRILAGLLRPTAGMVRLFGEALAGDRRSLLRRTGVMIEEPAFYPYLSGAENLRVLALIDGRGEAAVAAALEKAGLTPGDRRPFASYSVGMGRRLSLAAALLREPELLLLDEPTTGLDPDGQMAFRELVPGLAAGGATVLLSSHALAEVAEVCTRVGILAGGRLAAVGPVRDLRPGNPIVEVRVPEPGLVAGVLAAQPWAARVETRGEWVRAAVSPGCVDLVNATLVRAGIIAFEVRTCEDDLESVYRSVVREAAA